MTPHDLLQHLDVIAEAPNGIARLRELVLQLAVRGKLVPQDPEDEPASALLKRVASDEDESSAVPEPFELPMSWAWVRFGTITDSRLGKMLDKAKNSGRLRPYLRNANLQWFRFVLDDLQELRLEDDELSECSLAVGDLVICEGGEPGRAAVADESVSGMVYQKALHRVRPRGGISPWYLAYLLRCDTWSGRLSEYFTGATIKHLTGRALATYLVPLPPVAEQRRIVTRIDELMALLDRLEVARNTREATRRALRDSSLAALREADTPDDLESAWQRVAAHMDDLLTTPEDLPPFRQTILQLAVRGRLVPPSHRDEPAAAILERVSMKRAGRPTATASKRPDPSAGSESTPPPFPAPEGWVWCRLSQVCDIASGLTKGRKLTGRITASFPYLRVANVQAGYLDLDVIKEIEVPVDERDDYALEEGDVLLTEGGDWDKLGRSAIWRGELPLCLHQNHVFRARSISPEDVSPEWISLYTNSPDGRRYFQSSSKQTTNLASINMTQLRACALPVPPASMQRRILLRLGQVNDGIDQYVRRLALVAGAGETFGAASVHHLDL